MIQKKLHRFYVESVPPTDTWEIDDERLVHQIVSVLKFRTGESFQVFAPDCDDTIVSIIHMTKKSVTVEKTGTVPKLSHSQQDVVACVSIIKGDLFELVVQKLTELGVSTIVPILSGRTVKYSIRKDRLKLISREATEQSGQHSLVHIDDPMTLEESFTRYPYPAVVFDPRSDVHSISIDADKIYMYIGPEGGWSTEDEILFNSHNAIILKLCDTTLRTETAAIVGAYTLLHR